MFFCNTAPQSTNRKNATLAPPSWTNHIKLLTAISGILIVFRSMLFLLHTTSEFSNIGTPHFISRPLPAVDVTWMISKSSSITASATAKHKIIWLNLLVSPIFKFNKNECFVVLSRPQLLIQSTKCIGQLEVDLTDLKIALVLQFITIKLLAKYEAILFISTWLKSDKNI